MSARETVKLRVEIPVQTRGGRLLETIERTIDVTLPEAGPDGLDELELVVSAHGQQRRIPVSLPAGERFAEVVTYRAAPLTVEPTELEEVEVVRGDRGEIVATRKYRYRG